MSQTAVEILETTLKNLLEERKKHYKRYKHTGEQSCGMMNEQ